MNRRSMLSIAALAALISSPAAAQTRQDAAPLLEAARSQETAAIRTLEEMVLIESGSDDHAGVQRMAEYVEQRLRALGAKTERIPATTGGVDLVKGTFTGDGTLRAMLIAHMDTVYPKGILASEPFRREGNKLYGPGIADDKGGIAVILHALQVLQDADWRDYAQVTVLFNPDEEIGSRGSGERIAELGAQQDVVLSFEPAAAKAIAQAEGVLLNAAGTANAHLQVEGVASHAGAAADQGRNALVELAYQVLQTADIAKDMSDTQLNWTMASAGTARNQIPGHAEATGDLRFLSDAARERLLAALQAKIAEGQRVPGTTTTVGIETNRPPYVGGPRGEALAAKAKAIYAELDGRTLINLPSTFGGTDAGFAGQSSKPAVLESLGLAGWGYHAKNEFIEIDSIVPRVYLAARMLQELAHDGAVGAGEEGAK